jgi:hypothetical protein
MERNYLLQIKTPKSGTLSILVRYDAAGYLVSQELRDYPSKMTDEQINWLWSVAPKMREYMQEWKAATGYKAIELESDLSFEAFWDLYDHKLGNKKRTRDHWNKLDEATKALAMQKVKEYNFYMAHQTYDKVFAERWLAQKRYENEYRI